MFGKTDFSNMLLEYENVNFQKTCRKQNANKDLLELCLTTDKNGKQLKRQGSLNFEIAVMLTSINPANWDLPTQVANCRHCGFVFKYERNSTDGWLLKLMSFFLKYHNMQGIPGAHGSFPLKFFDEAVAAQDERGALTFLKSGAYMWEPEIDSVLSDLMRKELIVRARKNFNIFLVYLSHINDGIQNRISTVKSTSAMNQVFSNTFLCNYLAQFIGPDLEIWFSDLFRVEQEEEENEFYTDDNGINGEEEN